MDTKDILNEILPEKGITNIILDYKQMFEWQDMVKEYDYNWEKISQIEDLPLKFMEIYKEDLIWDNIPTMEQGRYITEDLIEIVKDKINWTRVVLYVKMTPGFIKRFFHKFIISIDIEFLLSKQNLTLDIINDILRILGNQPSCYHSMILEYQSEKLPFDFIKNRLRIFDINSILIWYPDVPEDFIEEHLNEINFEILYGNQKLTEDFMIRHEDINVWEVIVYSQDLTEPFMERYNERFNWDDLFIWQTMTEDFILKHHKKSSWDHIIKHKRLSEELIEKIYKDLSFITQMKICLNKFDTINDLSKYSIL